jgi:hypothetical protein
LFLNKYTQILIKPQITPLILLSYNYLIINQDLIEIKILYDYKQSLKMDLDILENDLVNIFSKNFIGLPINYKDYEIINKYYKFNSELYKIYLNDNKFNSYTDFDLFNYFLVFENDKFIFNFPEEFNYYDYLDLNPDLINLKTSKNIIKHFLTTGINENRNIYKNLENFDWNLYCALNNLDFKDKYSAEFHYLKFGKDMDLLTSYSLPPDFSIDNYIKCNPELNNLHKIDAINHFLKYGYNYINLPKKFNLNEYLYLNQDIKLTEQKKVINHFITRGIFENRLVNIVKINYKKKILCICHVGNINIFKKIETYINNLVELNSINIKVTLIINIVNTLTSNEIEYIKQKYPYAKHIIGENFGFDIGSFFKILKICKDNSYEFDYVIKIHTKTNDIDREKLLKPILGSVNRIKIILDILNNENIVLI